jgi:hypothetical protein
MEEQKQFSYQPKINEVQFPLFKFLKNEHAQNMLEKGEVYISNLYSFKNNRFGGMIDDNTEGEINIINYYDDYEGKAEEIESIMLLLLGPGLKRLKDVTLENKLINPDALIYCTTSYLLSDSLSWAIKEGKSSCVMISDSLYFFNIIYSKIKNKYKDYKIGACSYVKSDNGTIREANADKNSFTNKILHDRFLEFLLKPERFLPQREVRAIYRNNSESLDKTLEPEKLIIPEIKDFLFEIIFKDADIDILTKKKKGKIKMINILNSGEEYSAIFETPSNLMTPIIFNHEGLILIGFSSPEDKTFVGGHVIGEPAMHIPSIGTPVFACTELRKLSHIEIRTE